MYIYINTKVSLAISFNLNKKSMSTHYFLRFRITFSPMFYFEHF